MNFLKKRNSRVKFEKGLSKIYSYYHKNDKKIDVDFKKNETEFSREVKKYYENNKNNNYFNYIVNKRIKYLKTSYSSLYGLAASWVSSFISTMVLPYFNSNIFEGLSVFRIIMAAFFAFLVMVVAMIVICILPSTIMLRCLSFFFVKGTMERYNIEIGICSDYIKKSKMVEEDYISRKSIVLNYISSTLKGMALCAITLLLFWIFLGNPKYEKSIYKDMGEYGIIYMFDDDKNEYVKMVKYSDEKSDLSSYETGNFDNCKEYIIKNNDEFSEVIKISENEAIVVYSDGSSDEYKLYTPKSAEKIYKKILKK